jgi:hypothetical protein
LLPRGIDEVARFLAEIERGIVDVARFLAEVERGIVEMPRGIAEVERGIVEVQRGIVVVEQARSALQRAWNIGSTHGKEMSCGAAPARCPRGVQELPTRSLARGAHFL